MLLSCVRLCPPQHSHAKATNNTYEQTSSTTTSTSSHTPVTARTASMPSRPSFRSLLRPTMIPTIKCGTSTLDVNEPIFASDGCDSDRVISRS